MADSSNHRVQVFEIPDCRADINGDNFVDELDFFSVLFDWGLSAEMSDGDLNGDNWVDLLDLVVVINWWGACL